MIRIVEEIVQGVEDDRTIHTRDGCIRCLADRLGLDDFGAVLFAMPDRRFPKISSLLPAMASETVQDAWTGTHGTDLLRQTSTFVRSLAYNSTRIFEHDIRCSRILDYGCGYGRIARLMWYFVESGSVWGVDPWCRSIEECEISGMGPNFRLSGYMPSDLPLDITDFDIAYAFSVFTHLSAEATLTAFAAVRRHVRRDGMLMITIRPVEFWSVRERSTGYEANTYVDRHMRDGFAFLPQPGNAGTGQQATYGDTSMTPDWILANAPDWRVERIDRSLDDPHQLYVFLRAV